MPIPLPGRAWSPWNFIKNIATKISGEYSFTDFCDSDGYFYPDAIPTYKLANSLDKVKIEITVAYIGNGQNQYEVIRDIFYYDDVRHLITGVDLSYVMMLPIRSDEVGKKD